MQSTIRVIQHNANRQSAAQISVLQQAFEDGTHIVLFQEPSATAATYHFISHPAFQRIKPLQDFSRYIEVRPRTIAYFRKSFPYNFSLQFNLCKDPDLQLFEIYTPEPFFLVHLYNKNRDPSSNYTTRTSAALIAL